MKVMAFVMAFYIIMTTPRFPVMLKQLVGFTDSDVSLRLKTVADQAATSSITVSLVPLRIRRSTCIFLLQISKCQDPLHQQTQDLHTIDNL